jgi:hypothetical protein
VTTFSRLPVPLLVQTEEDRLNFRARLDRHLELIVDYRGKKRARRWGGPENTSGVRSTLEKAPARSIQYFL